MHQAFSEGFILTMMSKIKDKFWQKKKKIKN